jgi:AraC family transcriptional activator of mtrCDE
MGFRMRGRNLWTPGTQAGKFRTIAAKKKCAPTTATVRTEATLNDNSHLRISPQDLERLLGTLEVNFVALSECLVSAGYSLKLGGVDAPGIHYNVVGTGRAVFDNQTVVPLAPHTLIVVPPNSPLRIEVDGSGPTLRPVNGNVQTMAHDKIRRFTAGDGPAALILVCGYFHATYGASADLFGGLSAPVVERFSEEDQVDVKLRTALSELVAQEIGSATMSAALLKQVIVILLRRSLVSMHAWTERFALLSDARIARAFAAMAARPGDTHTVENLAQLACLSRSAFMARFAQIVGKSPMRVLRDLRLRQAMHQLKAGSSSVEQIAHNAGYASRSSFVKTFRKVYGADPTQFRSGERTKA